MDSQISFSLLGAIHYLTDHGYTVKRDGLNYLVRNPSIPEVSSYCDSKSLPVYAAEVCRSIHKKAAASCGLANPCGDRVPYLH